MRDLVGYILLKAALQPMEDDIMILFHLTTNKNITEFINTGKYHEEQHMYYSSRPGSFYHPCQIFYLCRLDYSSVSWRVFRCLKLLLVALHLICMYLLLHDFKTQIASVAPRCRTGGGASKHFVLVPRYYKDFVPSQHSSSKL